MEILVVLLALAAGLAIVSVAYLAVRRPILWRMAARNALRRPKQTLTVIAGLMIGTAIVSGALVASDSAKSAIRGYVYQSLGEIDESVSIQGYPYFPEAAYDALRDDPTLAGVFDGMSGHVIWAVTVRADATDLFEPGAVLVGYEPERDADFGRFELAGAAGTDGRDLEPGQAIVTKQLADALDAKAGDTLTLRYTPPIDPLLPNVTRIAGNLTALTLPGGLPLPPPLTAQPGAVTHTVNVGNETTRIIVALGWPSPAAGPSPALSVTATAPDGSTHTKAPSDSPLLLDIQSEPDRTLPKGTWSFRISSQAAVTTPYQGAVVVLKPVYDLDALRQRATNPGEFDEELENLTGLSPFGEPRETKFTVHAITDGGRGDLFDFQRAVFVRYDEAQEILGRGGELNLVKLSNPGDARGGEAGSDRAMQLLNASLERLRQTYPELPSVQSLEARPLKQEFISVADQRGGSLTNLLLFASSLTIITGLILITNIFTMLAEERRSELGMARAVGLRRSDLVRLFLFEGSLYAVAAAAIGAVLGLGIAFAMVAVMNAVVRGISQDLSFPEIPYTPTAEAVLAAFSVGALLTFLTILFSSIRQGRLNVVRAIRRIEEPERYASRLLGTTVGIPLVVSGSVATAAGWIPTLGEWFALGGYLFSLKVFGGLAVVLGAALLLRPHLVRRRLYPIMAAILGLYYGVTYFVIGRYENPQETNIVGPIRGTLFTLCVVVLVVHWDRGIHALGNAMARIKGLRAIAIPAVSYPLGRKLRTGMTLAMFSVVILSISFFSIFGALFQTDPNRQTGGYDIEGVTTLKVPGLEEYDRGLIETGTFRSFHRLPDFQTEDPDFITVEGGRTGQWRGEFHHNVYGFDADFVQDGAFKLVFRDPAYASDTEAYDAVLKSSDKIIASYTYSTNERGQGFQHDVGDPLQIHVGGEVLTFTIIGFQEQYHYNGVFLPKERVNELFPRSEALYLWKVAAGRDAEAVAKLLEQNYRDAGLDAKATVPTVLKEQESFRQVLGAMKLFLGLGLVVGVLSLGIVTSRSVLERRQEIGMLRALGYTGSQIRRLFLIEVSFTLLIGAVVGVACAIVVTYGLWFAIISDLNFPYVIPWEELGILVGISYFVALLATLAPIGRSAKVAPAEALRYLE